MGVVRVVWINQAEPRTGHGPRDDQGIVGEWLAEDLYHAAQQHRICVAPVMDFEDMSAASISDLGSF